MDPSLVLAQLLDLPSAFQRPGTVFTQIYNSLAAGEAGYSLASDGIGSQLDMPGALGPWLSTWGLIFGIPRLPQESDLAYSVRVQNSLRSPVATPAAIQAWSRYFLNSAAVSVVENLPAGPGYSIQIPAGLAAQTTTNWLISLTRIRPAGIPFNVQVQTSPLMLGTYSYIGSNGFAGAYLGFGTTVETLGISAETNNAEPLVPEVLLLDPSLNGQLIAGLPT